MCSPLDVRRAITEKNKKKNQTKPNERKTSFSTFDQLRRQPRRGSHRRTVPPRVLQHRLTGDDGQRGGPRNVLHDRTPRFANARLTRVQPVGFAQRSANAHVVPVHFAGRLMHTPANNAIRYYYYYYNTTIVIYYIYYYYNIVITFIVFY